MNVRELIEELDAYGDHVEVVLSIEGKYSTVYAAFGVEDHSTPDGFRVELVADETDGRRSA